MKKLKGVLYTVFFINLGMFLVEFASGLLANSTALISDSLDMFGDAFVYGLSLWVLSKNHKVQAKASLVKGGVMLLLGLYVFWEAFHKITHPLIPSAPTITWIGALALAANAICFFLLTKNKDTNINIRSAWICSRNDLYGNVSVIVAGFLVYYFNSMWPDIVVGVGIAGLVLYFSAQVIKESIKHLT